MTARRDFDVDIDVHSTIDRTLYGTRAMIYNEDVQRVGPHPSGVYLEPVPIDPVTGNCAFDYKYGSKQGFFKVDVLNNRSYDMFDSKDEVLECMDMEPDWSMLKDPTVVNRLPHIAGNVEILQKINPTSVEELADVLALIRPAKQKYIDEYRKDPIFVQMNLYKRPPDGGHYFKKAHAISYAVMIVCIMNKIRKDDITSDFIY